MTTPVIRDLTAESLFKKAVCVTLSLHKVGLRRKTGVKVKSKADQKMFTTTKMIIDSDAYRRITRLDTTIRRDIHKYDLPVSIGRGMALVPATAVLRLTALMDEYRSSRACLIDEFCQDYPERKEHAREQLKEEFRESEYPTLTEIRESFKFDFQFITFGLPEHLNLIDPNLAAREREKMAEKMKAIGEEVQMKLREKLHELNTHLLDRLTGTSNGKPKKLVPSAITKLMQYVNEFEGMNVSNDQELEKLVTQLRNTLQGVTPKSLKKDLNYRGIIRTSLESVKTQLDNLMVDRPTRRILSSDDDE